MPAEEVRKQIIRCKELTNKNFGVNLMLMNPQADQIAKVIIEEGVKVVTTGAGNPAKYMKEWKEAGIIVIPVTSATVLAKRMETMGADAIIAEGCEAGGHIGDATTMAVLPQMVRAVNIPVIAAGGIATGEQLLAAHVLGACGVQMGTRLLASTECPIHENYKQAILTAKDSDTTVTGRIVGAPVRILKNKMSRDYLKREKAGAEMMELEEFTLGSLRKAVQDGNVKEGSLMAGQVAGIVTEIKPLRAIFEELMADYNKRLAELASGK